jgi:hypothetical protein
MTLKEAYQKVKGLEDRNYLIDCLDMGKQWGFAFLSEPLPPGERIGGLGLDVVNKQTGEVSFFYPTEDLGLLRKSKKIPIKTLVNE